mmetsp:Transcript_38643/g.152596  ORF Transcript_38643/g.152596 Transcript_38643/m.152596 type:complete len:82 (-) Transcript_38643:3739-3984(-)
MKNGSQPLVQCKTDFLLIGSGSALHRLSKKPRRPAERSLGSEETVDEMEVLNGLHGALGGFSKDLSAPVERGAGNQTEAVR